MLVGESYAKKGDIMPETAMWAGNVILAVIAVLLLRNVSGYQSNFKFTNIINAITKPFVKFAKITGITKVFNTVGKIFIFIIDIPKKLLNIFLPIVPAYITGRFFSYFLVTVIGISILCVIIDFVGSTARFHSAQ
jgi:hypothetical protein